LWWTSNKLRGLTFLGSNTVAGLKPQSSHNKLPDRLRSRMNLSASQAARKRIFGLALFRHSLQGAMVEIGPDQSLRARVYFALFCKTYFIFDPNPRI
jgi:hypothetical protein